MSQELVDLTSSIVVAEIEDVLNEYPAHPYQFDSLMPELRHKLIAHILSNISNRYFIAKRQESENPEVCHSPLEEQLRMKMFVRASVLHILHENPDWLNCHLSN